MTGGPSRIAQRSSVRQRTVRPWTPAQSISRSGRVPARSAAVSCTRPPRAGPRSVDAFSSLAYGPPMRPSAVVFARSWSCASKKEATVTAMRSIAITVRRNDPSVICCGTSQFNAETVSRP